MTKILEADIAIIGGGLAGLTLANLLKGNPYRVCCIDAGGQEAGAGQDLRTTAISYGSRMILEEAGIWQKLKPEEICPIRDIRILDGASPLLLNFLSEEVEGRDFGHIVLNADLRRAVLDNLRCSDIQHFTDSKVESLGHNHDYVKLNIQEKQETQKEIRARLVIGADGRQSFTRQWMGVKTRQWSYDQRAVICTVFHENPHNFAAVEHFWPEGPFAILPMTDAPKADRAGFKHRSSVVFTEHGPEKESLMTFSDEEFEMALAARFPESYGAMKLAAPRQRYPLGLVHAAAYTAPRTALVADAAHGIHPIAGQGLNLGFRDVKALADLLAEAGREGSDPGAASLLQDYEQSRRFDNMMMVAVTDGLNRLFSNNKFPLRGLRKAGLKAVSKLPAAKRFFMRQAMGDR